MNFLFNNTQVQPKGKPIVYWIHKPSHTDIYADGYIGVTRNSARQRWMEHLALTKNNRKNNKLYDILKEEETLIFDVIAVGETREYCEHIEHGLRPTPYIGWNTAPGGKDGYTQVGGQINKERWKAKNPHKDAKRWWQAEMIMLRAINKKAKDEQKAIDRAKYEPVKGHNNPNKKARTKSGYVGVSWYPKFDKWRTQICIDNKLMFLGYYDDAQEAHKMYLIAKAHVAYKRATGMDSKAFVAFLRNQQLES
jgi:hypothetical protein